jgi:hypothetical protein
LVCWSLRSVVCWRSCPDAVWIRVTRRSAAHPESTRPSP